jgi:hypothetical protein
MVYQNAGQRRTNGIAVTMACDSLVTISHCVEIVDVYTCDIPAADGSLNIVGEVVVANKIAGGDVTVETRGSKVCVLKSGAAIAVGLVVVDSNGHVINYDASPSPGGAHDCLAVIGIALTTADSAGHDVDVLIF